jgi:hypothetical protein
MVIGKKFVWAHFAKTGGNSVKAMFDLVPHLVESADEIRDPGKHDSFQRREERTGIDLSASRQRLMTIRRLPSWVLSFANHQKVHEDVPIDKVAIARGEVSLVAAPKTSLPPGVEQEILTMGVDKILTDMMSGRVDQWLTTENLPEDFIRILSQFGEVTEKQRKAIRKVRANTARNRDYKSDPLSFFNRDELEGLYGACPTWSRVEREVYGGLLIDS